jgi:hypothetical protein
VAVHPTGFVIVTETEEGHEALLAALDSTHFLGILDAIGKLHDTDRKALDRERTTGPKTSRRPAQERQAASSAGYPKLGVGRSIDDRPQPIPTNERSARHPA